MQYIQCNYVIIIQLVLLYRGLFLFIGKNPIFGNLVYLFSV